MDAQGLGDTDDVVGESLLPAEAAERPACPKAAEQRVGEKGGFRSLPHSDPTGNVASGQVPSGQERMTRTERTSWPRDK
jgi:hypothetical protein